MKRNLLTKNMSMINNSKRFIPTFVKTNEAKSYTSKLEFQHYELNWTIENFEFICRNVKKIESPKFPSESFNNCEWFLELEPTELTENNGDRFSIVIKNTKNNKARINARISFFDSQLKFQTSFVTTCSANSKARWYKSGSEMLKLFGKTIPTGVSIICQLSVFDSLTTIENESPVKRRKCNDPMKNVPSLLSNENFKDVTFKLEDEKFTAHKAILAIQSPVFAAMFNSKMSEEQTSIVEIKDVKPKIFQQMLNFVYNVEIKDLDEVALELFYVAEKYQLEELRTNCINSLHKNLSAETVIKTLEMADFYSLSELKIECLKLLSTKWDEISKKKEWKNLVENVPYVTVEVANMGKKLDKENSETENNKSLSLPFVFRD